MSAPGVLEELQVLGEGGRATTTNRAKSGDNMEPLTTEATNPPGRDNAQAAYRSTKAPITGTTYISGYVICEYQCA